MVCNPCKVHNTSAKGAVPPRRGPQGRSLGPPVAALCSTPFFGRSAVRRQPRRVRGAASPPTARAVSRPHWRTFLPSSSPRVNDIQPAALHLSIKRPSANRASRQLSSTHLQDRHARHLPLAGGIGLGWLGSANPPQPERCTTWRSFRHLAMEQHGCWHRRSLWSHANGARWRPIIPAHSCASARARWRAQRWACSTQLSKLPD